MKKEQLQNLAGMWAIDPKQFETFCSSDWGESPFKASGEPNHRNNVDVKDGVAVLHIDGALTYRSNLWKMFFGEDTYNSINDALDNVLADNAIKGVVLSIDSPGGQVAGVSDLAEKIYSSRGVKPIVAHTAGNMCSAAYWIGAACDKVVAAPAAILGSVGVMAYIPGAEKAEQQFIRSNLSQNKNLDPSTPSGRAALERNLDTTAHVFLDAVAKFRGMSFDDVNEKFGQGSLFVGQEAVEIGMADEVKSLDALIKEMSNNTNGGSMPNPNANGATPAVTAESQQAAIKAAVDAERTRIAGVSAAFEGLALDDDCKKFVAEGKTVAEAEHFALEACKKQLAEAKKAPAVSATATPAAPAAEQNPNANLSAEQQALLQAGIKAQTAAANGVQAGATDPDAVAKAADEAILAAFAQGANIH